MLFDSGSDRSYITIDTARKCKLKGNNWEEISYSSFGKNEASKPVLSQVHQVELLGIDGKIHKLSVISIKQVCNPLLRQAIPQEFLDRFALNTVMADDFTTN